MKRNSLLFTIALLALASAQAQTQNSFTGSTGAQWNTSGNWSLSSVPTSSQDVFSANGTEARIGGTTAAVAGNLTIGGASGTSIVALRTDTANSLTVSGNITLAPGAGIGQLSLGTGSGSTSTLTIGGGSGSILDGGGAGASRIAVFGHMGTLGLATATADELNINQNSSGSLTIGSGQTYTIVTTKVGSATANMTDALTVNGTLVSTTINPGVSAGNGTNNATFTLNTGGLVQATTIQRSGNQTITFNWNGGTIQNKSGANLTVSAAAAGGTLTIGLAGTGTHTFDADSGQTITVATTAVLADQAGQNGTLTKAGLGTLTINSTNTYTGATSINAGTVQIGNTSALGSSGNITFGGGTLQYGSGITTDLSSRLKNSASAIGVDTGANNVTFDSAIDSTNSGGLTKSGSGNLTLNGTNTYTGPTTISAGTLVLGASDRIANTSDLTVSGGTFNLAGFNEALGSITGSGNITLGAGTLTTNSSSSTSYSGIISGSGGSLTKQGAGTLTLSANNTYTGATTISAGALVLTGTNTASAITINSGTLAGTGSGGATTVAANGRISPGGASVGTLAVSTLTLNGTGGYIWNITDASGAAGTGWDLLNVGGGSGAATINANSGSPFTIFVNGTPSNFTNTNSYSWNIIDWGTATGFSASAFTVNASNFSGADASATWSVANNSGYLQLLYAIPSGTPTYSIGTGAWTGNFTPALSNSSDAVFAGVGGTATNDIPTATLGTLGTITFNSTAGAYTLAANSGSAGHSATPLTLAGSLVNNSTATQTINLSMNLTATRVVDAASGNITIGGVLSGIGGLTKNGTGSLTLTAANDFSGAVQVNQGTLATSGSSPFNNNSVAVASGATLDININSSNSTQLSVLNSQGSLLLTSGTLFVSNSSTASSINGTISGGAVLRKGGASTLAITNSNSGFSGQTRHEGGVIEIGNDMALGTGEYHMRLNGITIRSTDATDRTLANRFGTFVGTNATYNFGSASTGNLTFSNTQSASLGANRTFNILNALTQFNGNFTGTDMGITKSGTGTMILAGNSAYTGSTTVSAGALRAASATALGTTAGGVTVASGAALELTGGISIGAEALSLTGSGISNGGALRNISGTNSYAGSISLGGATTIASDAGTLTLTGGLTGTNTNLTIVGAGNTTISTAGLSIGSGTLTKNGDGTLTLNTSNTYSGATTINGGTLNASHTSALGTNATINVNGGSLLVSSDGAINGKNITLASAATGGAAAASLAFSGTYNGTAGSLTLNENSIIDLGTGSVFLHFSDLAMGIYNLAIYNWTGTTLWSGGDGNNTDQFYIDRALDAGELNRISFYSGIASSSFVGTAYQISAGSFAKEIIPVPEAETYVAALLLLLGSAASMWHRRRTSRRSICWESSNSCLRQPRDPQTSRFASRQSPCHLSPAPNFIQPDTSGQKNHLDTQRTLSLNSEIGIKI